MIKTRALIHGTIVLLDDVAREVANVRPARRNHRWVDFVGGQQMELPATLDIPTAEDGPRSWAVCYITREQLVARWQVWRYGQKVRHGLVECRPLQTDTAVEDEIRHAIMGLDRALWDQVGEYRMVFVHAGAPITADRKLCVHCELPIRQSSHGCWVLAESTHGDTLRCYQADAFQGGTLHPGAHGPARRNAKAAADA
jgi:hypothetical protein